MLIAGLWEVRLWGYYYGLTAAQIELMTADCPIVSYKRGKDKKGKKDKREKKRPAAWKIDRKARDWQEKYGHGDTGTVSVKLPWAGTPNNN